MHRPLLTACAAVLSLGLVVDVTVMPAPAVAQPDPITSKRDEARRIAAEIEELGARASRLVEAYHEIEERLDRADVRLLDVRLDVERARRSLESTQTLADERLADMYRGGTRPNPMSYLDVGSVQEIGVVQHYARTLADDDRRRIGELAVRRRRLDGQERRLEAARAEVAGEERALRARRTDVESAMAAREAALARAEGELADLVATEQRRRDEAEARRVQQELARRQVDEARRRAEEEARRLAATTTTLAGPSGSDDGGQSSDGEATTTTTAPLDAPDVGPAPPVHPNAGKAVEEARAQLGKPYLWAGNGPESFDCSGLTRWAWAAAGVSIPRSSQTQYAALPKVDFSQIQPGDLLFYGSPIHHVGIFVGDGQMVNAPYTGEFVRVDSIYRADFAGAARPG
jgi:cell wall-associated NlpC family hydrolase